MRLELSPSRALAAAIFALHAAAAGCLLAAVGGAAGTALALLTAALGAAAARDRALLRGAAAPRALLLTADGAGRLERADGGTAVLRPVRGIGVTRFWVALRVAAGLRRGLLVTAAMLAAEDFRRLRVWALWGRVAGGTGAAGAIGSGS